MGLSNYPDGMRESDIPGYWDTECPDCDGAGTREDDYADEPGVVITCRLCGGEGVVDSRDPYGINRDYEP